MKSVRFNLWAVLAALLLVSSVAFTGCKTETETEYVPYTLSGKWVDSSEATYEITNSTFKNYGKDYDSYEGDNLLVSFANDEETAGYIYIKYTKSMNPDGTYSADAPDVGKWYAIAFKNLSEKSISISGAYKKEGITSTETLEEAMSEFTVDRGYFAYYSDCVKK